MNHSECFVLPSPYPYLEMLPVHHNWVKLLTFRGGISQERPSVFSLFNAIHSICKLLGGKIASTKGPGNTKPSFRSETLQSLWLQVSHNFAIGCEIKGSKSLDTFNCVQKYDWRIGGPLSAPMFAFKLAGNEANGIHLLPPFPPPIKGTNTGEEWAPLNPVQTESRKQKFD